MFGLRVSHAFKPKWSWGASFDYFEIDKAYVPQSKPDLQFSHIKALEFAKFANQIANQLLSRAGERTVQTGTSNIEKPYQMIRLVP